MPRLSASPRRPRSLAAGAVAATLFALAAPARAQGSGDGFLLGAPVGSLSIRGGYDRAAAGSDIFSFATNQLTLSKNDFSSLNLAADLGIRITDRFDFTIGSAISHSNARSEDRKFIDNNDLPIEQSTRFTRVPLTASVKAYLAPRGRSIGRFAWVPTRVSPYVGAGVGLMWYKFNQEGDFVDYKTLDVFTHNYESSRWGKEAHALAGIDYSLTPHVALTTEARYTRSHSTLSSDFSGFRPIDLSGASATAGVSVRF